MKSLGRTVRKTIVFVVTLCMVLTTVFSGFGGIVIGTGGVDKAYAAAVGDKNKQACDDCERVVAGTPPAGYTPIPGTEIGGGKYAVYSGGNSKSQTGSAVLDNDPTDFAKPLPYGNVYVDANKLKWDNPEGFIIDIKDNRFKWVYVSETPLEDKEGNVSTNDPMGLGKPLKMSGSNAPMKGICYVGPLKSFHEDIKAAASDEGHTNVITPQGGAEYLYRITYLNAVTLPDGTKGNLVLTMKKVQIETSVTVDADHPYKPAGANYSYANAFVKVQGENQLSNDTGYNLTDSEGNQVNQQKTQILTKAQATALMNTINGKLPDGDDNKLPAKWEAAKSYRNATGNILDLEIVVTDSKGDPVKGTISYAAHDMDFESAQNVWGRPVGGEFGEGMTILSGSQSYALVPDYRHDKDGLTRDTGWLPVGPGAEQLERALNIERVATGSNADGIRFASPFLVNYRDKNGKLDDVIYNNTDISSFQGDGLSANNNIVLNKNEPNLITDVAKKQLYVMLKAKGHSVAKWQDVTAEMAWEKLGNVFWKTYRNDNDVVGSFDSGFAVLLSSEKSKIQWSGSRATGSNLNTTLFDTTLFTYIEQTHGTGGGIYFESYDITDNCKVQRREGVTTMGRGASATVTAVPEDGYRVKTLIVGGEGLSNPTTYEVEKLTFTGNKYVDSANGMTIEKNSDGSYDVTFADMQDPRHVHVDFTADYHFYKVWKGEKAPTTLNMTATPYAFVFRDVEIGDVKYTISNKGNTLTNTQTGMAYTLENNAFTVGEAPNIVIYYLEGNSLVTYKMEGGNRVKDNEYPIRLDYVQNGDPVKFTVTKADADNTLETHVTKGKEDGYTIWKITYPADGYTTQSGEKWPALPIESKPSSHNINHVERNYWFVTEEAPGWSLAYYDNSKAEAPGKIDNAKASKEAYKEGNSGDLAAWASASIKDYTQSKAVIRSAADNDHAYMSVFNTNDDTSYSWGGKIVNVPAVVVNAEKTWKDFSNGYNTRQDVWFHIDAQLEGEEKITDFLPPQKLSSGAEGGKANSDGEGNSVFTVTWGDRKAYSLEGYLVPGYSNVRVVGTAADIPRTDKDGNPLYYQQDKKDSHKYLPMLLAGYDGEGKPKYSQDPNGITYYVNELEDRNGENTKYTFTIRETDANGNELNKTDPTKYLYSYKSEVGDVATSGQVTLDGVNVDSYTGKVTNTLETVEFNVTKVWADGLNKDSKRPADGAVTYAIKKQAEGETESAPVPKLAAKGSAMQGNTDITSDYANGRITVKTDNGDTVKFAKLPKYSNTGKLITYSVEETAISGYRTEITGDMTSGYKVTNIQKTEVYVEKEWDDANNQDGVRPMAVEFELLKGGNPTGTKVTLSESTVWKGKFTGLDKYDANNNKINYGAQEVPFDAPNTDIEYTAETTTGEGTKDNPFKIKNSRTPETIEIKATKVWDDSQYNLNDRIGIRFDAIFSLYGDGRLVTKHADGEDNPATAATGEKHDQNMTVKWTVDKYRNGRIEIAYNVVEDKDPTNPYSVSVTENPKNEFTVTNTYPPIVEEKIVTRTITYTYLTEDGQTASTTVTQKVKLIRTPTVLDLDGGVVEWTGWTFEEENPDKRDIHAVNSPSIDGWETKRAVVPEWEIDLTDPRDAYENVIYTPLPPVGTPDETYGAPGDSQTGTPKFEVQTPNTPNGSENKIVEIELLDKDGNPATTVEVSEGTYVLNDDGTITFTPNDPTFIGDPTPVKVRGTDSNGKSAETTYTPHIVDNTKTVKRTITYEYEGGTPVKDDQGNPLTKEQSVTFTGGIVDPKTGKVTFPEGTQKGMDKVDSDPIDGYTVDRPQVQSVTVEPTDDDMFEKVVYSPKGITASPDETYGLPGEPQTGTPTFEMETKTMPDGTPNSVTITLIDPESGESTDTVTIPGQGTYTLNSDGTITFTPEDGFVGDPDPVGVRGTDRNGKTAETTYTPHIVNPEEKGTATRTIHYRYLTEDGEEVTADTIQSVTLYRKAKSVDPKTGEVTEWDSWTPDKFPAVKNPDDKVDGDKWFTDDSVGEMTVTEPGEVPDEYVIYKKIASYSINYDPNGGTGEMDDDNYSSIDPSMKDKKNTFTRRGYHYTGFLAYMKNPETGKETPIVDDNGNPILFTDVDDMKKYFEGMPDGTSIRMEAQWEPNHYRINYDPNGGTGSMDSQDFTGTDRKAKSKKNAFTRDGYSFTGFTAYITDPATGKQIPILDSNGNPMIFKSVNDFMDYFHEYGHETEITLVAQWEKLEPGKAVDTGDDNNIAIPLGMLSISGILLLLVAKRKKQKTMVD